MAEGQVEIKRRMEEIQGRKYEYEWFDIERPLNEQEIKRLKHVVKSLDGSFGIAQEDGVRKHEQYIYIQLPRRYPYRSRILNRIVNIFEIPNVLEVFVDNAYGKRQAVIRKTIPEEPNKYLEELDKSIVHLYLRLKQI